MLVTDRAFRFVAMLVLATWVVASPAAADLSVFAAVVGFDDEASLDSAPGIGLRWGQSSGIFAGETSLMISRPDREVDTDVGATNEAATAIFYEVRFLVNIPAGSIKPFVGVGYGAITILPGDLEKPSASIDDKAALEALSETETSQAFSYGAGVRYALNERIDARVDVRQYQVFSVKGAIGSRVAEEVGAGDLAERAGLTKERTVQYNELSAGIVFRF